ncbi:MAG: DUF1592 domain-containing protein [Myxococcales bacterium]|nr:DUF1592 domain-containing protein [Myxococcales bacterium]
MAFAAALLALGACGDGGDGKDVGAVGDGAGPGAAGGATDGAAGAQGGGAGSASDPMAGDPAAATEDPAPAPRAVRLTHGQWQNTVIDLLHLDAAAELPALRPDPSQGGFIFDNDATAMSVDEALWSEYQRAAMDLAARVVSDPQALQKILPAGADDPTSGLETFVRDFGRRAHRRPLDDAQVAQYLGLTAMAPGFFPELSAFDASIRLLLEAFLQSPHLLYRFEASVEEQDGMIVLDDWEIASRLSYSLWQTMPDDALFDAAAASELSDPQSLVGHVTRVLDDPRLERSVASFHAQLFEIEEFREISPATTFFPDAPAGLGEAAVREHQLFVQDVVFEQEGGFRELLSSTQSFVDADLAGIYGLGGTFGSDFEPAQLDAQQRKGLLTQVGFLAANASSAHPDPIHRGVFIAERIACLAIAAPDAATPPVPAREGRTNREVIEDHTEMPGTVCASCHSSLINPFGFPFENYDATGAYRTEDNGYPVDASASPPIDGMPTAVDDALGLIDALAGSEGAHQCYSKHWMEFLLGRHVTVADRPLRARLGAQSQEGLSVKQLLRETVTSRPFLHRSTEELP